MSVIDSGFITESLKTHLMELESERLSVEKGIVKANLDEPELKRTQVVFFLRRFRNADTSDVSWRIYLVETFLQAAYLYDDGRLLLHLNFSGDGNEITVQTAEDVVSEGEPMCSNSAPLSPPEKSTCESKCFFQLNPPFGGSTRLRRVKSLRGEIRGFHIG